MESTPPQRADISDLTSKLDSLSVGGAFRRMLMLCVGFGVSLTMLMATSLFSKDDPMLYYHDSVFPIGALSMAIACSIGFGLSAFWLKVKIRSRDLLSIILIQLSVYAIVQYACFIDRSNSSLSLPNKIGFWDDIHVQTTSRAFRDKKTGQLGPPLGMDGYFFRGLEIVVFAFGGLAASAFLVNRPFCDACNIYMNRKHLGKVSASAPIKHSFEGHGLEETRFRETKQSLALLKTGIEQAETLGILAGEGKGVEFKALMATLSTRISYDESLPVSVEVGIIYCSRCATGKLTRLIIKHGIRKPLETISLSPAFVQEVCGRT